jgi:ATP-dependent DNA helicase RecQ
MGKDNERIPRFGHDKLSVYGIGTEHNQKEWQSLIRQLVASNYLSVDMEGHGGLQITPQGLAFLKEKQTIQLRLDPAMKHASSSRSSSSKDLAAGLDSDEDRELFKSLKALRMSLAKEHNVPPYVIFHDKSLMDMAAKRPANIEDMAHVHGVGQSKLDKYGDIFLRAIEEAA